MLRACIAEYQTAGRGRRGRRWSTPLGAGLCLSVGWQFADAPAELSALTLAVGVVVRRALARVAGVEIALKWPNDLVWDERKLGGILLELTAEGQGGCHVVAGIGINVALPPEVLAVAQRLAARRRRSRTAAHARRTAAARACVAIGLHRRAHRAVRERMRRRVFARIATIGARPIICAAAR